MEQIRQVYQMIYQVVEYRIHRDCRFVQTIRVTYFCFDSMKDKG